KLLYKSEDIVQRLLTDLMDQDLYRIVTNDKDSYNMIDKKIKEECKDIKLELEDNIIDKYDLRKQLEELENRKIWLKCGGFITIDKTEALTAIDVNSGKYTGNKEAEATVYKVNCEATTEIAKQLKLRDIGGIIIIDNIDRKENKSKEKKERQIK